MLGKYRFQKKNADFNIGRMQEEIEDNLASNEDLDTKQLKVTDVITIEPTMNDLSDGEKKVYYDGTDTWKYERYGSQLFKTQITKVT